MPIDSSIRKVMVIGSGPIVIGQAAEFDYAGAQACRVLHDAGVNVVLVNSNPATIMTDKALADEIYLEPLTLTSVKRIIEKEQPDSLLAGLGGQTGLTLAMELDKEGFLQQHNVRLIGTNAKAIDKAEDRELFKETMAAIQLEGERFDLDERIAAELFGLSTPKPKNLSKNKMDGYRERHDRGELHIPLSLPEKQKREEAEADTETDYSTMGEYTKALSNMTLDELALDRF